MKKNFTIHIFGYGETQYIQEEINFKTTTTELTAVQPLLDAIWLKKPEDTIGGNVYHSVNIFKYKRKSWNGKGKDEASFNIKEDDDSLVDLIDTLIAEIKALVPKK